MTAGHVFPDGTVLTAYPKSQWGGQPAQAGQAPKGSAASGASTPTVASGAATFTNLADNTTYYATAVVNAVQTYVQFSTPANTGVSTGSGLPKITSGVGTPVSNVVGSIGDLYLRSDGGASTTLYVKESGAATTAGWVAK